MTTKQPRYSKLAIEQSAQKMSDILQEEDTCFFCHKTTTAVDVLKGTHTMIECPDGKQHVCCNHHHGVNHA